MPLDGAHCCCLAFRNAGFGFFAVAFVFAVERHLMKDCLKMKLESSFWTVCLKSEQLKC